MAYTLGNKCAKNLCKRIVLLQLIIENVVTCFFWNTVGATNNTQHVSACRCPSKWYKTDKLYYNTKNARCGPILLKL